MKRLIIILLPLFLLVGCSNKEALKLQAARDSIAVYQDSLTIIKEYSERIEVENKLLWDIAVLKADTIRQLKDSIELLNAKPIMTVEHFTAIYKYDRLYKYYRICKKNPSQWKFYKGWSKRVFELNN